MLKPVIVSELEALVLQRDEAVRRAEAAEKRVVELEARLPAADRNAYGRTPAQQKRDIELCAVYRHLQQPGLTAEEIHEGLTTLCKEAAPGPWEADIDDPGTQPLWTGKFYTGGADVDATWCTYNDEPLTIANALFTAMARSAVPALLHHGAALTARVQTLERERMRRDEASLRERPHVDNRPVGCLCTWEYGDSPCPVHDGKEDE